MRRHAPRRLAVALLALAGGVGAAVALPALAPGDAPPTSASFTAVDFSWDAGAGGHTVTIAVGGTVTFGYPSGSYAHNADFSTLAPTSCTQSAGADSGPVPPLPAFPTGAAWSGSCRFNAPGTYAFHCDQHPTLMQGTVEVVDPNAPSPPTTTGVTTTVPPPGQTNPPPGATTGSPGSGGGTAGRLRASFAHRQRGTLLRGTVTTPTGRSRVVVTAFVSNRALAVHRPRQVRAVRVGSQRKRSDAGGSASFELALGRAARAALQRRGRLAVELRIVVTAPSGRRATATATVTLRAPAR
jgi:plastocyanin